MTELDLEHNNFNQSTQNHAFLTFLLTSAIKQIINNDEFVETKKGLTLWKRVIPMRHA